MLSQKNTRVGCEHQHVYCVSQLINCTDIYRPINVGWCGHCSHKIDWSKFVREKWEILLKFCMTYCQVSGLSKILLNQLSYSMSPCLQLIIHIRYLQKLLLVLFSMHIILKRVQAVSVDLCVLLFVFRFVCLIVFVVCW